MTSKTFIALKGSIEKWKKIVAGTGTDNGGDNCPLCILYANDCNLCPVKIAGFFKCIGSPYDKWAVHQEECHNGHEFPYENICPECEKIAKKELKFLKSLLPKENK